jgi:hypothetical protein
VIVVVAAGLLAANMLGVAAAEAPTSTSTVPTTTTTTTAPTYSTPAPTVSVDGVATVPVAQGASAAVATAAYREGMTAALADGHSKAEFLAGKAGVTLGGVQSIAEGGGSISCTGGEESGYAEYQGEQPDFGSSGSGVAIPEAVAPRAQVHSTARKKTAHKPAPKKKPSAKAAAVSTCTLSASVSIAYAIS